MQEIILSIESLKKSLSENEAALKKKHTDEEKEQIQQEIKRIKSKIAVRFQEFEMMAVGGSLEQFADKPGKPFDWKAEIKEIVSPFMEELKNITKHPREIEKLRKELGYYKKYLVTIEDALQEIIKLTAEADDDKVKTQLNSIQQGWQEKQNENKTEIIMEIRCNRLVCIGSTAILTALRALNHTAKRCTRTVYSFYSLKYAHN